MRKSLVVSVCFILILFESACSANSVSPFSSSNRQIYEPYTIIGYDEDGDKCFEETINKYGETENYLVFEDGEKSTHEVMKYEYDDQERTIRKECWVDEELDSYDVYEYDGNIRNGKTYDEDGDIEESSKAILNEKGLPIQIERYVDGFISLKTDFFYDEHGEATKIVHSNYDTSRSYDKWIIIREYTYKNGRLVDATITNTFEPDEGVNPPVKWKFIY